MCSAIFKHFSEEHGRGPFPPPSPPPPPFSEKLLLSALTLNLGNILYCQKIPLAVLKNEAKLLDVEMVVWGGEYF